MLLYRQVGRAEPAGSWNGVAFRSAATVIEIDGLRTTTVFRGLPPRPDGRYDLVLDGVPAGSRPSSGGRRVVVDPASGTIETQDGTVGSVRFDGLPAGDKRIEIWLPHTRSGPSWWRCAWTPGGGVADPGPPAPGAPR